MRLPVLLIVLSLSRPLIAQEGFTHIRFLEEGVEQPSADIDDVSWIAGHWRGEAFGGIIEEIWSPPLGGSMMASFKLVVEGEVSFYEIETISEVDGSLLLRLKHFGANLHAWEEKEETIDFPLVALEKDAAYFDGMTFKRNSENQMDVYVGLDFGDGTEEMLFRYTRE
jgi:hypothetical protein